MGTVILDTSKTVATEMGNTILNTTPNQKKLGQYENANKKESSDF